jgi:AcrR family transcriptional regulator
MTARGERATKGDAPAATEAPARPLTARGQRTRAKLVKAARRTFERKGYLDTNIQDISTAARVAYGTFYTYFASKEEVFAEVVEDLQADLRAIAESEPPAGADPASRIARTTRGYLRGYRANAAMMAILEQVATFSPRLAEVRRHARRERVDRSHAAIARWQARGLVRADVDPALAATALGSMVDRSAYVWFVLGESFDEERAIEQLTLLYCAALGLDPPPAPDRKDP